MTVAQQLRSCTADAEWLSEHLKSLRKNPFYRDRYVAVNNRRVIAVASSYPEVVRRLYARKPAEADTAVIERVSSKPCAQVL